MLVLTTFHVDEDVVDALRAGASGFLLKDVDADRLLEAIRVVHAGTPSWTRRSPAGCSTGSRTGCPTAREDARRPARPARTA